ncbi:DUF5777 family beta-barrel protein [Polaribacter aquimarinus]|uniref:DUF5777 domain-containing protein n=1 Tax=Polaribacter aquimarinus TaxID=2100726 RepID=A0A2U2JAW7_9FLAO|nr:DUF5777 family beta-barrel protein [Polaribacter aquimarinus]PWG05455.1 hypothetical protein DIS07_09510 [Polaribacter aquimarinus]
MKLKRIIQLLSIAFTFLISSTHAQSLLDKLDKEFKNKPIYEIATFKTTRIGLNQSVETRKKGALQISLFNRYWDTPNATSQSFLADKVSTRYGLEYAFSDKFTFGAGYSNFDKITDTYFKFRLYQQQINSKKMPVSITFFQSVSHRKVKNANPNLYSNQSSSNKFAYTTQVLVARKMTSELSVQIAPTFIIRGANSINNNPNSQFAIAFGGRHKIGKHSSVVSEYFYVANPIKSFDVYNTFMVGLNWEVSDLMLQFHITNARNYAEDTFISETTNNFNFKDPNLHFGVNATFILHTRKKKLQ